MWINGPRCARRATFIVPLRMRSAAAAMRLYSYRDESQARHFDLIAGGLLIN
jgi:hypothetical protein